MTSRSLKTPSLLPCALLALTLHASHCFAQTPSEPGPYRIAGHIVSASDGHPLQRATVQILHSKTNKAEASTIAAEDGSFAFANLKAGAYILMGNTPGYIASRYDAHAGYSTAIVTGAGVDTESLVLKLAPEGDISGHVTDEAGDPVRRANVSLYRENHDTGSERIIRAGGTQTDNTGNYDISHLSPGKYFLSATATPWYAVHPQPPPPPGAFGVVDSLDPSLDVAYPTTFYPDVTDSSAAAPITVKAGDQVEIDIRLSPIAAVTMTVPRKPEERNVNMQLQKKVFDGFESVPGEMRGTQTELTYVGLPPGQYVLRQLGTQNNSVTRTVNVNLTERTTQVEPAQGEESASLKVLLKTPEGAKLPPQGRCTLVDKDGKQTGFQLTNQKGEAQINSVEPGEYSLRISVGNQEYFVTSITSDTKTLPDNHIQLTAGSTLTVTVTAAPASATLAGFANTDGKPAPGVMMLLLPAEEAARTGESWKDQSDLDGSFTFANIPPGRYTLLAIQDGWDLEWQREDVISHYLPLGQPVTIPTTTNASLKLPAPIAVQPR